MIIHFVGSRYEIADNIEPLRKIVDVIKSKNYALAHDWVEEAYNRQQKEGIDFKETDWTLLYKDSVEAINKADVVVAETSTPSFSVGYQVALAVSMKKPTLVLSREGVEKSFFASGIEAGVEYKKYNIDTVGGILSDFLASNDIATKDMRFNFFIDRPIYNYLRWAALKTGKTKAEILRSLVQQDIDRRDS